MKKTQWKDALRNIRKQKVSYFSILVIAMLAVMTYLGVNFASQTIRSNANAFYDETEFRDAEIISTTLLTGEDLEAIRAVEGVADAESVWQTTGIAWSGEAHVAVCIESLTERINLPKLVEGQLPHTGTECAVHQSIAESLGLRPGDRILVQAKKGGPSQFLTVEEFTVTGIMQHPDYACSELSAPGDRNIVVLPGAFDRESLEDCFMKAEILFAKPAGIDRFGKDYAAAAEPVLAALEVLSSERAALRDASIRSRYEAEIESGQEELDKAQDALQDARGQLDSGREELEENQHRLEEAEKTLEDSLRRLQDGSLALEDAEAVLADAKRQLDDGEGELAKGRKLLDQTGQQIRDAEAQLAAGKATLEEKRTELAEARAELDAARQELADGKETLESSAAQLEDARLQLAAAEQELADARAQLEDGEQELSAAAEELRAGEKELADAKKQIDEGDLQLAAAADALEEGARELAAGQSQLDDGAATLLSGYEQIEQQKQEIRDTVKEQLVWAINACYDIGDDASAIVESLHWAGKNGPPNLYDPSLDATTFALTDEIVFQLSQVNYVETVSEILDQYDLLFQQLLVQLEEHGIDPSGLASAKAVVSEYFQMGLEAAAGLQERYNSAVSQLEMWNDGHRQYLDGVAELSAAYAAYSRGEAEYRAGEEKLREAKKQYEAGLAEYEDGKARYEAGLAEYEDGKARYEAGLAEYEDGEARYAEGLAMFRDGEAEYAEKLRQFNDGKAEYEAGEARYAASLGEFRRARELYESGLAEFESKKQEYTEGVAAYEDGLAQYEDGRQQLMEGRETLDEKEAEYAEGVSAAAEGEAQLNEARETMDAMESTRWVLLGTDGNASCAHLAGNIENISDLGTTFALVFVLVGALVIYATVGRIVEEQRRLVGATKALGLYNREVFLKYLCFGVSATLLGMLLGILVGYMGIQRILTESYARFYMFDNRRLAFLPGKTLLVFLGGIALSVLTVWSACNELLRSTATSLMQEKAPKVRKAARSGRSTRSLYARLILLNMSTDKKRVAVTIASVMGCCTLLVTGFALRSSVRGAIDRQFSDVTVYDAKVVYDPAVSDHAGEEAAEILGGIGAEWTEFSDRSFFYKADDGGLISGELLCGNLSELDHYFCRRGAAAGETMTDQGEGLFLNKRIAELLGVGTGDRLTIYDLTMKPYSVRVAGVFELYTGRETVMTERSYRETFGGEPERNAFLVNCSSAELAAALEQIRKVDGVTEVTLCEEQKESYLEIASVLDVVALLFIVLAGMMAYFILLNLASMYISQKTRELTIMRINGFTLGEVIRYVAGESVATTGIGILLGFGVGALLTRRMIALLEDPYTQFLRGIQGMSWVYAAVITLAFAAIIYAAALRKVKHLKLTDLT